MVLAVGGALACARQVDHVHNCLLEKDSEPCVVARLETSAVAVEN